MKWVDVLNEALSWSEFESASRQVQEAGRVLRAAEHARLVADAALLRRLFVARHLGLPLQPEDGRALLQWMETVTPALAAAQVTGAGELATLCSRRQRDALVPPFEAELTGALLQFLATVEEPFVFEAVHRCHGVQRRDSSSLLSPDVEHRFAERAALLDILSDARLAQCPRLIVSPRGRRFCSKACSNATFAARKALQDPQYFAEKQERYRQRQSTSDAVPVRERGGAFVYMD